MKMSEKIYSRKRIITKTTKAMVILDCLKHSFWAKPGFIILYPSFH